MQAACHQVLAGANSAILRKTNCPVAPAKSPGLSPLSGGGLAKWGYGLSGPAPAPSPPPAPVLQSSAPQIHSAPPTPLQRSAGFAPSPATPVTNVLPARKSSARSPPAPLAATPARFRPASLPPHSAVPPALPDPPAAWLHCPPAPTDSPSRSAATAVLPPASNLPAPCVPAVWSADNAAALLPKALHSLPSSPDRLPASAARLRLSALPPPQQPPHASPARTRFRPTRCATRATSPGCRLGPGTRFHHYCGSGPGLRCDTNAVTVPAPANL